MSSERSRTTVLDQLGAHTFIWSPRFVGDDAEKAAAGAQRAGVSIIEIPLLDPSVVDVDAGRLVLQTYGLTPTCSLGLPPHAHAPADPDEALAFLREGLDVAAGLGSRWLTGALYGHLGHLTGSRPTNAELLTVAEVLREAADHAATLGVQLGIEIINRYETYLINTVQQAIELIEAINRPNVAAHLDTFHANIEEADIADAVHRLGPLLGYVHLGESNRGIIGSGTFRFDTLLAALDDIEFAGPVVIEAFMNASPDLLRATASWRNVGGEPNRFLADSITYLERAAG